MIGLSQFESEQIPLEGGKSRGLGVVKLDLDKRQWFEHKDDPHKLLKYLEKLVSGGYT